MTMVDPKSAGYCGAVYAAGMVYFVPSQGGAAANSLVMRYDTTQPFFSSQSWSKFDAKMLMVPTGGFFGGFFDGKFVTFVPNFDGMNPHGVAARFDTTKDFKLASSWNAFDFSAANASAIGFFGGVFDGMYGYFAPFPSGWAVRFSPTDVNPVTMAKPLNLAAMVDSKAKAFIGGVVAKGAVYFVPATDSLVTRYPADSPDFVAPAFDTYDIGGVTNARGWCGGATDGDFVYYAPYKKALNGPRNGVVMRYDTRADFKKDASWSTFDTSMLSPPASAFQGAMYDGKYVYFVPREDGVVARFDARQPRAPLPMGYSGSFL